MQYMIRTTAKKNDRDAVIVYLCQIPDELLRYFGVEPGDKLTTFIQPEQSTIILHKNDLSPGFKVVKSRNGEKSSVRLWKHTDLDEIGGRLPTQVYAERMNYKGRPSLCFRMENILAMLKEAPMSHSQRHMESDKAIDSESTVRNALKVARQLSEVFDPDKGVYDDRHSDQSVAAELNLSVTFVQSCREQEYGPLANSNHKELTAIRIEFMNLQALVTEQIKRIDSLVKS